MKTNFHEYELALLGQILSKPSIVEEYSITAQFFDNPAHRGIYNAIQETRNKGLKPDLLTISDELEHTGHGDLTSTLAGIEPCSTANAEFYAEVLRERLRADGLKTSLIQARQSLEQGESSDSIVETLFSNATTAMQAAPETTDNSIAHLIEDYSVDLQSKIRARREHSLTEIGFGIRTLDALSGAIHPGEVIIIAARPGTGKSALALQTAMYCAESLKLQTAFFSLEMLRNEILDRLVAQKGAASLRDIRDGRVTFNTLYSSLLEIGELPFAIYDGRYDLGLLRAQLRREKALHNLKVAFLDYIGLIDAGNMGQAPRWERIADISRNLKLLALELKITIFIVSQLNREADGQEPMLGSLRDSGSLEQDADRVLLLYRPNSGNEGNENYRTVAHLAKNRHGRVGRIDLTFNGPNCRFEDGGWA